MLMILHCRRRSIIFAKCRVLLFLLAGLRLAFAATAGSPSIQNVEATNAQDKKNEIVHRVFPAASIESYNPHNLPPILGVLSDWNNISFAISISSTAESDPSRKRSTVVRRGSQFQNRNKHEHDNDDIDDDDTGDPTTAETPPSGRNPRDAKIDVESILKSALVRFQDSLGRNPEFRDEYPVNPSGLPLLPIAKTFLIDLESPDVDLYHGVSEGYEIDVSVETPSAASSSRADGFFDGTLFDNPRNSSQCDDGYAKNFNLSRNNVDQFVLVSIKASTVFGVLRALETLGQLIEFGWVEKNCNKSNSNRHSNRNRNNEFNAHLDDVESDDKGVFVIRDVPLHIVDSPAFPYRGLMIDTARHFLPMNLILDNLDAMAMNKLNVLHWHISDSQSFPYAPQTMPELAQKGAFHPRRVYTPGDVRALVREAYVRGIRVIPEIDVPGHTNAIAASHPEVMSRCPHPSEPMNPTVSETYKFIRKLYLDLADVFPDEMVHVGGDEVQLSEACWLEDPAIAGWMKDHGMGNRTVELYEFFETRLFDAISGSHKTPIVWQEVFDLNLTIPSDAIVDVWKGFDRYSIQNATRRGHRVILSGCWYLDHLDQTWESFYKCDPLNFTSPRKELLIGGHASMWAEHVDASNFVSRVWPRASAAAERLWHGTTGKAAAATVAERIHRFRCRMVASGFAAGPTGPGVCPTEVAYAPGTGAVPNRDDGPGGSRDRCARFSDSGSNNDIKQGIEGTSSNTEIGNDIVHDKLSDAMVSSRLRR